MILLYEGGFRGFLGCVFEAFARASAADPSARNGADWIERLADVGIERRDRYIPALFAESTIVPHNGARADRTEAGLMHALGREGFDAAVKAYLSERPGIDTALLRFFARCIDRGMGQSARLEIPENFAVFEASRRSGIEAHRFMGLVRFRELEVSGAAVYYAPIESDCFVLPLIARHFADRFNDRDWVIHDAGRDAALVYRVGSGVDLAEGFSLDLPVEGLYSGEERLIQAYWRRYYADIAIDERVSRKRLTGRMPVKYWKYLVERN
jgi:probable DNA metabolism protein